MYNKLLVEGYTFSEHMELYRSGHNEAVLKTV